MCQKTHQNQVKFESFKTDLHGYWPRILVPNTLQEQLRRKICRVDERSDVGEEARPAGRNGEELLTLSEVETEDCLASRGVHPMTMDTGPIR